jgi:YfiR/HmsC-like
MKKVSHQKVFTCLNMKTLKCRFSLLLIIIYLLSLAPSSVANAEQSMEYEVKAAFIYNFTKFTEWPDHLFENKETPIRICILGKSPFGKLLNDISRSSSQNRALEIKFLSSLQNALNCHVVFISRSKEKKLTQILRKMQHLPILTTSDINGFAQQGGIIGLTIKNGEVHLKINFEASKKAGVKLSSKLLDIATLVKSDMHKDSL